MKALKKLLKFGIITYIILFIVFFFDLDGKFLYYVWQPLMKKHFDEMPRRDLTKTPYEQKEAVDEN